jgi:antitoxin component of RelBE/YafQ-DinJ toxin-antitoxin module
MSHPPDKIPRSKLYTVRLSAEEDDRARRVSEYMGIPISTLFRMLLLERERVLGLDVPKLAPKRRSA